MKKLLIDTDPGIDDVLAIALAARLPEIDLVGITTVAGNTTLENATENALRFSHLIGLCDVPLASGAARPLEKSLVTAESIHGENGLGGITLPPSGRNADPLTATDLIARVIQSAPEEVTIVAIGPLTNIARLFERVPGAPERIRRIVVMGGAFETGNITPRAEYNFYVDPEAADRVLRSGVPVTIVPLDTTHRVLFTEKHLERIRRCSGVKGRVFAQIVKHGLDTNRSSFDRRVMPLHDPTAVALAARPELAQYDTTPLAVAVEEGPDRGRVRRTTGRIEVRIPSKVETGAIVDLVVASILEISKSA